MTSNRFLRLATLAIGIQLLAWAIFGGLAVWFSPALDRYLEIFVYAYYPTVTVVASFGNFVGVANIIEPILIGVLLGILIYGILISTLIVLLRKREGTTSTPADD